MAGISFDMRRIGATIAQMRREKNMTQMQLADEMGVSFQAVSNWERGQSMPDISKLPELAELFRTTIDHLLGRKVAILEAAASGRLADATISAAELADAAPLLTPEQLQATMDKLDVQEIDSALIPSLLPFLDTARVDALMCHAMEKEQDISSFFPFASESALDATFRRKAEKDEDFTSFLPFIGSDTIESIARERNVKGQSISNMLPFMHGEAIDAIAIERSRNHQPIDDLLPFVTSRLLQKLADLAFPDK